MPRPTPELASDLWLQATSAAAGEPSRHGPGRGGMRAVDVTATIACTTYLALLLGRWSGRTERVMPLQGTGQRIPLLPRPGPGRRLEEKKGLSGLHLRGVRGHHASPTRHARGNASNRPDKCGPTIRDPPPSERSAKGAVSEGGDLQHISSLNQTKLTARAFWRSMTT